MSAVFWLLYCLSQFHMLYSAPIVTDAKSCNIDENCLPIDGKHGLLLAPAITAVKDALQHAKCYSLCVNEIVHLSKPTESINCTTIRAIESCQEGCFLRNLHPKKMRVDHCSKQCVTGKCSSRVQEIVKLEKEFGLKTKCMRQCKKELCETGCNIRLHNHKTVDISLPTPDIQQSTTRSGFYRVKETKIAKHGKGDKRIAMVIKIVDVITNDSYYDWQPGLKTVLDLRYFACKEVEVSTSLVYGHRASEFSDAIPVCVKSGPHEAGGIDFDSHPDVALKLISRFKTISRQANQLLKIMESSSVVHDDTVQLKEIMKGNNN